MPVLVGAFYVFFIMAMYVLGKFLVFALLAWVICLALGVTFSWGYPVVIYILQIIIRMILK